MRFIDYKTTLLITFMSEKYNASKRHLTEIDFSRDATNATIFSHPIVDKAVSIVRAESIK